MNTEITKLISDYENNRLSHAILIETNNQSFCRGELISLFKKMSCLEMCNDDNECSLCRMIENGNSLNLFYIYPDGKNIKKEQIFELKDKCKTMPVFSKNNIYVISEIDKLNASSANAMLKFIEEPVPNCYGFFLTNNKDNIITTIKSRCEIIKIKYDKSDFLEINNMTLEEYELICSNLEVYLYNLETKGVDILINNKDNIYELVKEKEILEKYFRVILDIYQSYYIGKIEGNMFKYDKFKYIDNLSISNLNKKINIIITFLNNMSYNLNIDLSIDKFAIEMSEVNE